MQSMDSIFFITSNPLESRDIIQNPSIHQSINPSISILYNYPTYSHVYIYIQDISKLLPIHGCAKDPLLPPAMPPALALSASADCGDESLPAAAAAPVARDAAHEPSPSLGTFLENFQGNIENLSHRIHV